MRHLLFPNFTTLPAYVLSSILCGLAGFGLLTSLGILFSLRFLEPGLTLLLATCSGIVLVFLPTYVKAKAEREHTGGAMCRRRSESWLPANPLEALEALLIYGFALTGIYYLFASMTGANFTWFTVVFGLLAALPIAGVGFNRHLSRGPGPADSGGK